MYKNSSMGMHALIFYFFHTVIYPCVIGTSLSFHYDVISWNEELLFLFNEEFLLSVVEIFLLLQTFILIKG